MMNLGLSQERESASVRFDTGQLREDRTAVSFCLFLLSKQFSPPLVPSDLVFLFVHSFERGVAPAGRAQATAADRAPPTGEPAGGRRRCVPASPAGQGQRAESDVHVELPGPRGPESLQ